MSGWQLGKNAHGNCTIPISTLKACLGRRIFWGKITCGICSIALLCINQCAMDALHIIGLSTLRPKMLWTQPELNTSKTRRARRMTILGSLLATAGFLLSAVTSNMWPLYLGRYSVLSWDFTSMINDARFHFSGHLYSLGRQVCDLVGLT